MRLAAGTRSGTAVAATLLAITSYKVGAAIAKPLIVALSPEAVAFSRLALGGGILLVLSVVLRQQTKLPRLWVLAGLAAAMGGAIVLFYLALERLPLALAASIQFLGPLAIALMTSRKPLDAVLACVASIGVWLLVFEPPIASLNLHGVAFAFGAAGCWAAYIGFARLAESTSLFTPALALLAASLVLGPFGALEAGQAMASSHFLPLLVALAVLSAAIPVTLELFAVPRMPVRSFATLMSCEPVLAACAGAALLGEYLSVVQSGGIALIAGASIGVVMRSNLARSSPACAEAASRIHADRHIPDATRCAGAGDRRSNSRVSGATDAE